MRSKILDELLKETPKDVEIFVDWYADLVVRVNQLMREKGISQKDLADRMDKNPSEISKWMSGEHNFTLRSLAKLQAELGAPLIEVPQRRTQPIYIGNETCRHRFFVSKKQNVTSPELKLIKWEPATEKNLLINVS